MAKRTGTLSVDRTEIIFVDTHGKDIVSRSIIQDQVASIVIDKTVIKKLFSKTETERITINVRNLHPSPYLIQSECGDHWEQYKADVEAFCKRNRIDFSNEL